MLASQTRGAAAPRRPHTHTQLGWRRDTGLPDDIAACLARSPSAWPLGRFQGEGETMWPLHCTQKPTSHMIV